MALPLFFDALTSDDDVLSSKNERTTASVGGDADAGCGWRGE